MDERRLSTAARYFFSAIVRKDGRLPPHALAILTLVSLLPFAGAVLDRSLFLPEASVGLLEHYGNLCFAVILPIAFLFMMRGIRCFDRFLTDIEANLIKPRFERELELDTFLEVVWARDRHLSIGIGLVLAGIVFATANAVNACRPETVWGHDVYDSCNHIFGYVTQRVFFYFWWAYLLPILIYRLIAIIKTLNKLFNLIIKTDSLVLHPMHPDNAGGLGALGGMAANFNFAILQTMAITAALYWTHGYNGPLVGGTLVQFLLIPVVFFLPLLRVHAAMKHKKRTLLMEVARHYQRVSTSLMQKLAASGQAEADQYEEMKQEFEDEFGLGGLYRSLERMPTWPFDSRTIAQFLLSIVLPLVIPLLERLR